MVDIMQSINCNTLLLYGNVGKIDCYKENITSRSSYIKSYMSFACLKLRSLQNIFGIVNY